MQIIGSRTIVVCESNDVQKMFENATISDLENYQSNYFSCLTHKIWTDGQSNTVQKTSRRCNCLKMPLFMFYCSPVHRS